MKRFTTVLLGASVALLTSGCSGPPTADIEAAKAKVQAISAEDAAYAPEAHEAAQDAVAQLDAEIAAQGERFALSRSYDRASELAAAAGAAADRVQEAANTERSRLQTEAGQITADARRALGEATQSLETMPAAEADPLKADAAAAQTSLDEAESLLAAGQLREAQQKADEARQAVGRIGEAVSRYTSAAQEAEAAALAEAEDRSPDRTVLPRAVTADGTRLAAGTYRLRVTDEEPAPVVGQPAGTARWIEFVRGDSVAGRALAVVLTGAEAREIAESPVPGRDEVRVEQLKEGDYLRVWLNQGGTSYLVHLPFA